MYNRIIYLLLYLLIPALCNGAGPEKLLFCNFEKANPPYVLTDAEKKITPPAGAPGEGVSIEMFILISAAVGVPVEIVRYPWKRCLALLKRNAVQGVFHAVYLKEREQIGAFPKRAGLIDQSRMMFNNAYYLYKARSTRLNWDGKKLDPVPVQPVAAGLGYSVVKTLKSLGVKVVETFDPEESLDLVLKGRLAAVASYSSVMTGYLNKHPDRYSQLVKLPVPVESSPHYLMLSHQLVQQYPELSEAIWNEIRDLRESGIFDQLMQKYSGLP